MGEPNALVQVVLVAGSAVAFSFGLARAILRQTEQHIAASQNLLRDVFAQLDKRLQKLEEAVTELTQTVAELQHLKRLKK